MRTETVDAENSEEIVSIYNTRTQEIKERVIHVD